MKTIKSISAFDVLKSLTRAIFFQSDDVFIPKYVGCVEFTCTAKVLHGFEYFGRFASYC